MRAVIEIRATKINYNEVFVQMTAVDGEAVKYLGSMDMMARHYRPFIITLLAGSHISGDAGMEIKLQECDFDIWKKENVHDTIQTVGA
jgi:hypothetical protein